MKKRGRRARATTTGVRQREEKQERKTEVAASGEKKCGRRRSDEMMSIQGSGARVTHDEDRRGGRYGRVLGASLREEVSSKRRRRRRRRWRRGEGRGGA